MLLRAMIPRSKLVGPWLVVALSFCTRIVLSEATVAATPACSCDTDGSKACSDDNNMDTLEALLEWLLRQEGAYWNPKQTFDHDEHGIFGVFADEFLPKDTLLAKIPWTAVIRAPDTFRRFDNCDTVQILKDEIAKGNSSFYWPYTKALQETARDHYHLLPAHWSTEGQELLTEVLGDLPPEDIFLQDFAWKDECEQISKEATLMVLTHAESIGMVPITDRYNSRDEPYKGAYYAYEGNREGPIAVEIRAGRDLKAGEQIYLHYKNYPPFDDMELMGQIGTLELLRDYGFVESYPQLYILHDQEVVFSIYEEEELDEEEETNGNISSHNNGDGALVASWYIEYADKAFLDPFTLSEDYLGTDKEDMLAAFAFISFEYHRLKEKACPTVFRSKDTVTSSNASGRPRRNSEILTEHELETMTHLCHSLLTALELAVKDLEYMRSLDYVEDLEEQSSCDYFVDDYEAEE